MSEIFTTPSNPGQLPGQNPKSSSDTKLNWLIGGAAVFLVVALGVLGWVLITGGDDGPEVATAEGNESTKDRDTDSSDGSSKGKQRDNADQDDSPDGADPDDQVTLPATKSTRAAGGSEPRPGPTNADASPDESGGSGSGGTSPVTPIDVTVSATRDSVSSLRCTGLPLGYYGSQLIDGDLETGWGASKSDGSGQSAVFDFGGSKQISTVGITPGYLRVAERSASNCAVVSAFPYNRFIESVRWEFEDGTSVVQNFEQRGEMQSKEVNKQTSFVRMEILSTTRPAGADDDTVISEAEFTGTP